MLVRSLDEITDTDLDVRGDGWRASGSSSATTASASRCRRRRSPRAPR